jgi:D-3-phosphoglycerate dehydrogenase / 2-oxoglutarate reductase
MTKKKILLLEGIHPGAKSRLESYGYDVRLETASPAPDDLIKMAQGVQALGIRSKTQLTEDLIKQMPSLETIGCFCIGTDQVALKTANGLGVPVFNAPYSNTRSVAELVICEMIALSRRLADRSQQMHKGVWNKSAVGSMEVRGKTLGIVGYGHIGSQLSVLAESMGLQVIFYDIVKKLPLGNARPCESLHECLARADFVSLHVPDTALTQGMMGGKELQAMKKGAYLINASRGLVVDIPALAQALRTKHLSGAALDVFPAEPASNKEAFQSEVQELENVILTPQEVAESFRRYFQSGATTGAVNFPVLDVAPPADVPRVLNIHRNVPGVLGAVNSIISEFGGNIVAQHLATDANIGYLIMDVGLKNMNEVAKKIAELKTSIRTRVL